MTQTMPQLLLPNSEQVSIKGHQKPRIWTPPKLDLSIRENSYGYNVIDFGKLIGMPLDPWQEWLVIHIGELSLERDDKGNRVPQKDRVLTQVARQNGKTLLVELLSLYWMFVERHPLILGMNATATDAVDVMKELHSFALDSPYLSSLVLKMKEGNTDPRFQTTEASVYKPVAASERAGRGKRPQRVIIDELRLHKDWKAYNAAIPAMSAQKNRQAIFITNAGYDDSVVLNSLRKSALDFIDTGVGDEHLAIYEWSAPDGSNIYDPQTWAYANPSLGVRKTFNAMKSEADTAKTGTKEEANFRTEHLCMHVKVYNAAINPADWAACYNDSLSLKDVKPADKQFCLDLSWSRTHATLAVAGVPVGSEDPHVGMVHEWRDKATANIMRDIRNLVKKYDIKNLSVMPVGPAADFVAQLEAMRIPGLKVHRIAEQAEACMVFADLVSSKRMTHHSIDTPEKKNNEILTRQAIAVERKDQGDRFKFERKNHDNADAVYAAAGAVYMVKSRPAPLTPIVFSIKPKERS